jgi:UDP-N-acetylmuramoylalanine--D-glutamate ligase
MANNAGCHVSTPTKTDENLIELGDVLVLGMGMTGVYVARYLAARLGGRVSSVTLYGGRSAAESPEVEELRSQGVHVVLGSEEVQGHYDLCIASPGISEISAFFCSARACSRGSLRNQSSRGVKAPKTGWPSQYEGKTTTTTLVSALLHEGGCDATSVGNIGYLATKAVSEESVVSVCRRAFEFSLACTQRLHPHVAVLLNITPDHISWHGSLARYAAAKERIFQNLTLDDLAVVANGDQWCLEIITHLHARHLRVCVVDLTADPQTPCAAFPRDGRLIVRLDGVEHDLASIARLNIKGTHNVENALPPLSLPLSWVLHLPLSGVVSIVFSRFEHRIEPCGELNGVSFVNDSKATNTDAVEKALSAFAPHSVVLLVGGHDKGTDLSELAHCIAADCAVVVCYGEAGPRLVQAIASVATEGKRPDIEIAPHMADALDVAILRAHPGQTILLSPACSSFDEFSGFEERGRVFKQLVMSRIAAEGGR